MKIMDYIRSKRKTQKGFALPMVLGLMLLLSLVGASIIQTSVQTSGSAVLHSRVQIAHIASKAAIDYAEEQYELDSSYNGTPEQDLFSNDSYRATIEVVILYNQTSSSKRVQGIGRVYVPELAINAKVVRDIKSTIIRNGEVIYTAGQTDPATFNPMLWLDANAPNSLYKAAVNNTQTITALYNATNKDIVEERGSDATTSKGLLDFTGDDLEMSYDTGTTGHQVNGIRFRSVTAPKNATINNAYIQFQTDETKSAGSVQMTVKAVASDNAPVWNGNFAVSSPTKTTASTNWTPPDWNSVGQAGANERVDVTPILQEIVNRNGWASGNAVAFSITWVSGSGIRTAEKGESGGNPQLFVQWNSAAAGAATSDGDSVDQWYDRSGNNRTASFVYGTKPILKLNQVNGLNAVRFSANGALQSAFSNISGTELVAFMVMLPRTSTASNGRFLSLMNSSQNNDNNTASGLIPFMKNSTSATMKQLYNGSDGRTISNAIDGNWAVYSSQMSTARTERLLKNSTPDNSGAQFSPNYTINQIYVGGRRSTSAGADYSNMDVAEVIVYNRNFLCSEIQQIENYLEAKYAFDYTEKSPCP